MFLIQVCIIVIQIFLFVLFMRVMLSWLPIPSIEKVVRILGDIVDPVLQPFQKIIPPIGGIDLTPMIIFFLLSLLEQYLFSLL
ncbi:MAG: YggT family protein [Candidatus Gracilibacteria bacterium]